MRFVPGGWHMDGWIDGSMLCPACTRPLTTVGRPGRRKALDDATSSPMPTTDASSVCCCCCRRCRRGRCRRGGAAGDDGSIARCVSLGRVKGREGSNERMRHTRTTGLDTSHGLGKQAAVWPQESARWLIHTTAKAHPERRLRGPVSAWGPLEQMGASKGTYIWGEPSCPGGDRDRHRSIPTTPQRTRMP